MDKKNFFVTLAAAALFAVPVSSQTIDVKGDAEPFTHYWSVGVGACDAGPYPGKSADGPAAGAYPSGKFVGNRRNHQHNRRPHQQQRHKPAP